MNSIEKDGHMKLHARVTVKAAMVGFLAGSMIVPSLARAQSACAAVITKHAAVPEADLAAQLAANYDSHNVKAVRAFEELKPQLSRCCKRTERTALPRGLTVQIRCR